MRRTATSAVVVVGLLAFGAAQAAAAAPKFHAVGSSVDSVGALVVTFDERGLGNEDVTYTLTADSTATYACINRGGKNPAASNKRSVSGEVTDSATFEPRNGRVVGSMSAGPPTASDFTCPSGQRRVLADVTYTNIVLTDTTNNVSTTAPDASRTFFTV